MNRVSTVLKRHIKDLVYFIYRYFPHQTQRAVILMYHSIDANPLFMTVATNVFEAQVQYLKTLQFNVVSLDTLAHYIEIKSIPKKTVILTFDDGYQDNYKNAFPILRKYSIPATIFVTTGDTADKPDPQFKGIKKLSTDEFIAMEKSGLVSIEPHSVTHPKFTHLQAADMEREITSSKQFLDTLLHKNCQHFAYPKGYHNEMSKTILRRVGIRYGYTVQSGTVSLDSDPYTLSRNSVDALTTYVQFKTIVMHGKLSTGLFRSLLYPLYTMLFRRK